MIISFFPLMLFSLGIYNTLEKHYIQDRTADLQRQANIIAGNIISSGYLKSINLEQKKVFSDEIQQKSKEIGARIMVFDAKGIVLNDSNKVDVGKMTLQKEVITALEGTNATYLLPGSNIIHAVVSIKDDKTHGIIAAVMISASIEDIYISLRSVQKQLYVLVILTTLVVGFFSFYVSGVLIRPLKELVKVIQKVTEGHLDQQIPVRGKDEIADLTMAFNHMSERLLEVDRSREEFVANVSHELKTPLSSIKVLSESLLLQEDLPVELYQEFLEDITSEVDRQTAIINDLLALVKIDGKNMELSFNETYLNTLIEDILKRLHPLAMQKNIELIYESRRDVYAKVDEIKLTLAISNLVENGIKYNNENGTVSVILDADHQNAFITIQDTGIGIPEEEQKKIFDRFYRIDKTRDRATGGTGLGLAITQRTVLLHQGSIRLTSKEGEGCTFILRIPLHLSS
ncbi:MAG: cell wall metabolism sensor histidine kinase WalK [Epulopiscium sp.]|nr:cell wall metabolism sensor histidine kinase WalK [Candidatus Epulonipiscium sp.]